MAGEGDPRDTSSSDPLTQLRLERAIPHQDELRTGQAPDDLLVRCEQIQGALAHDQLTHVQNDRAGSQAEAFSQLLAPWPQLIGLSLEPLDVDGVVGDADTRSWSAQPHEVVA